MKKTRMPTVAGLLNLISGAFSFPAILCSTLLAFLFAEKSGYSMFTHDPFMQRAAWVTSGLLFIAGVLAIVGGIYALSRKRWGLALAGSIAALFPILLPGIVSIILTVKSKKEFQLREYGKTEDKTSIGLAKTSIGLAENVVGMLCYVLGWVSGLVFLLIEHENKFVRFHALQSIIIFGSLTIANIIEDLISTSTGYMGFFIWVLGMTFWIVFMVTAYLGKKYKLPWVGDLAEKWTSQ